MDVFFISYRIHGPKPDHHVLGDHIKALGKNKVSHPFDNTWLIATKESAASIKADLEATGFQDTDKLLIAKVTDLKTTPQFEQLHLDTKALRILQHQEKDFAPAPTKDINEILEYEKQIVFVVSCDHQESNTNDIEQALEVWATKCEKVTTSTWTLYKKNGNPEELCKRIKAKGGIKFSGLVVQLNSGSPPKPGPFVYLLGEAAKDIDKLTAFRDIMSN